MRRTAKMSYGYKPHFEYYSSSVPTHERHSNGTSATGRNGYKYNGLTNIAKTNQSFSLPSTVKDTSPVPLPSNDIPWSSGTLTSQEKVHYKKALKEIYDTIKIGAQNLETESDISEEFTQSDTDKQSSKTESSSPKPRTEGSQMRAARNMRKSRLNEVDFQEIYRELRVISQKLKNETRELQAWEEELRQRESFLKDAENVAATKEEIISETLEEELERRYTILDEEYQYRLDELQKALVEKTKEASRLRDSFNTIRSTHEDLRKQFLDVQDQNRLLESQTLSLQQRLNNLLRKNEYHAKQREGIKLVKFDENFPLKANNDDTTKSSVQSKFNLSGILDVLASLLIWVSDGQLDYTTGQPAEENRPEGQSLSKEIVHGKCVKILPPLADLLSYLPAVNPNVMYPLLKFIYSVILYTEQAQPATQQNYVGFLGLFFTNMDAFRSVVKKRADQKPVLTSTLRRIGEELYKPEVLKPPETSLFDVKKEKLKASIYLRSSNLNERMLSTLIILKTISRADYLSHTFDVLKSDLREEEGKRLFILHNGVRVVIPFMKQKNKSLLEYAVDVILQMSMESSVVSDFLMRCGTGDFFNVCTNLLQEKGLELKILEKFSIILQRLSKIRSNRRYFEAFQLAPLMQELLREHESDNAFLSLNLRSVLVNLNIAKGI